MTTERSEDCETPLAGLPLFSQPVPPAADHATSPARWARWHTCRL